jgi:glycosyltransferase involved in cell wall biosynthesis
MNIAIVQPVVSLSGAGTVVMGLGKDLLDQGHNVHIITCKIEPPIPKEFSSLPYIHPEKIPMDNSRLKYTLIADALSTIPILRKELSKIIDNCDIINPHTYPSYLAATYFAHKKPIVWTCNEIWPDYLNLFIGEDFLHTLNRKVTSIMLRPFDTVIVKKHIHVILVLSKWMKQRIKQVYDKEAIIIRTPINNVFLENGDPSMAITKYGLENKFVILQVGWIQGEKNPFSSLYATYLVAKKIPNVVLIYAGPGHMRKCIEDEAAQLGIKDKVLFTGLISQNELRDLYAACNVNLFVPLKHAWGLVPFEALAQGKISIVSSNTGAAEVIMDNDIGIVTDPTPQKIAEHILRIYKNPDSFEDKVKRGQEFVRKELTRVAYAKKMIKVFENVLAGKFIDSINRRNF